MRDDSPSISRVSTSAPAPPMTMPAHGEQERLPHHHAQHVATLGAERHPDADFLRPLRDAVRDHAVDADGGEQKRRAGKAREQQHREAALRDRVGHHLVHRLDVGDGQCRDRAGERARRWT